MESLQNLKFGLFSDGWFSQDDRYLGLIHFSVGLKLVKLKQSLRRFLLDFSVVKLPEELSKLSIENITEK